jgi:hypothetical protein
VSRHRDPEGIDPDALTTDPDTRIRQLNLSLYSARIAAEKARAVYALAIKRMRAAEINASRAVCQKRQKDYLGRDPSGGIAVSHPGSQEPHAVSASVHEGCEP